MEKNSGKNNINPRHQSAKSSASRAKGAKPTASKPTESKSNVASHTSAAKPSMTKSTASRPATAKPPMTKSTASRPATAKPSVAKSASSRTTAAKSSSNVQSSTAKKGGIDKKAVIAIVCVVVAVAICLGVVLGVILPRKNKGGGATRPLVFEDDEFTYRRQAISYAESTDHIDNPDQGFYRPIFVAITPTEVNYNKNIVSSATRLYHLRIDISAFSGAVNGSGDMEITDSALEGLDGLFAYLLEKQKNAVVRFAYDKTYSGKADCEPSMPMMLKHIARLSTVLDRYRSVITAIEVGMFGPWGEMHTSKAANSENISAATKAFLDGVRETPVLVRTPRMMYNYLGISIDDIDGYTIDRNSLAYRLGIFNDGYLGSSNDLGTYSDREREIEFLSRQTEHLPYGGEVVIPGSTLHDIDNCTAEMFKIHLSYLNIEWNNQVIDKWKNTRYTSKSGTESAYYGMTAFDYINNRMGYRFVVSDSVLAYSKSSDAVTLKLEANNVGFGNLTRKKKITAYLIDGDNNVTAVDGGEYSGGNISVELKGIDADKAYKVYVALHDGEQNGLPAYSVRFANPEMWNDDLQANYVGKIER